MQPTASETSAGTSAGPREEYVRRQAGWEEKARKQGELFHRLARWKRYVLAFLVVLIILTEKEKLLPLLILPPALLLEAVRRWRSRTALKQNDSLAAVAYYERRLAFLDDRWAGLGNPGNRFLKEEHPYALDLDLFGTGGVFELLCTARTGPGEETLAGWLLEAAAPETIRERHAAVTELRPRVDLREEIALLEREAIGGPDWHVLVEWATAPPLQRSEWLRWASFLCPVLIVATFTGWMLLGWDAILVWTAVLLAGLWAFGIRRQVRELMGPIERRGRELVLLAAIAARCERERWSSQFLCGLQAVLHRETHPASVALLRLSRRVRRLRLAKESLPFTPIAPFLLWRTQYALALDAWRQAEGQRLAGWLAALGELEAVLAVSRYAYEHPSDPFPELTEGEALFQAQGLGHPLLPAQRCVRNDVCLGADLRLLMVSGSNMAGKSTLLRAVGVNAILALAGTPVRAHRLRLSQLRVGATLRVQDSLQAGQSRFYAEVRRVRQIVELAKGPGALLFLLDELFHGTNSDDRCAGAEGVLRALLDAGAVGLVTTHDLALTGIAERLAPRAANVYLADRLEDGVLGFDYRLRPGVVPAGNALELMRSLGIDV